MRLAEEELKKKQQKKLEKSAKKGGKRVVQTYGTIYAGDARLRIIKRNEWDFQREKLANEAKDKALFNKLKTIYKRWKNCGRSYGGIRANWRKISKGVVVMQVRWRERFGIRK